MPQEVMYSSMLAPNEEIRKISMGFVKSCNSTIASTAPHP